MQRRIDLLDKHYSITILSRLDEQLLQVETSEPQPVALTVKGKNRRMIQ
ncbi:MAG: hypothetical protein GXP56_08705 [Deltaproteobacteria bacterium]|nr:hypothetical protein [Deltaproteobacteria bacterium]